MADIRVPRSERLEMIKRLIEKNEVRCARLCCQSWNIAESVFKKFVRESNNESAKEMWLQ